MKRTIGFFGDSFCANRYSLSLNYKTYVSMLSDYYNAKIVNLGKGGSSIGDLILLQLTPFIQKNNVPDICIFVWTDPQRLFHRSIRNLNWGSVQSNTKRSKVWESARDYFTYLNDWEFTELQYLALLEHVDNNVLPKLPAKTKIVHLWSFGMPKEWNTAEFKSNNLEYFYTWKNGVEVRPALMSVSMMDNPLDDIINDKGPNHLSNKLKNELVFNYIKSAIDSQ
jgi:hypothetical protein